jgi:uncharacterized protein
MMEQLFSDRARPLYGQALPMRLERLTRLDLITYISERFEKTHKQVGEALDPLLDVADGHPQRAMLLAHGLWLNVSKGAEGDYTAFTKGLAYAEREVEPECEALWRCLSPNEQRTLRAIAAGHNSTIPRAVYESLELSRQTSKDARTRLVGAGYLDRDEENSYRFIDPLFRRWVHERAGSTV